MKVTIIMREHFRRADHLEETLEKAILAGYRLRGSDPGEPGDEYDELAQLASTAGASVAAIITQKEAPPTPGFFIGKGKAAEIAEAARDLEAGVVIFNHELTPLHFRNLEKELGVKVIDRTQLILDIFAMRAHSAEGKIQVELAQLEYLLPRMTGKGVELSRLGGGIGTRGPGETKLEVDRRRVRTRISVLKKRLRTVEKSRATQKNRRARTGIPLVALAGYTNAGKSTLFNALCGENTFVEDKLFATLDPLTRKVFLPASGETLLTDTVGFIRGLPVSLVEAFKSTLEGVAEAQLILHVVDISDPAWEVRIAEVNRIINELGAGAVPTILVLNKCDALDKPERLENARKSSPGCVEVSAKNSINIDILKRAISDKLASK